MSTANITIVKLFNENNDNERYFTVLTLEPMSMTEMLDILFGDIEDERLHVTPVSKEKALKLGVIYGTSDISCEKNNYATISESEVSIMSEAIVMKSRR
jgi:hypothetical protein